MNIVIHREGREYGPYTLDMARAYLEAGQLAGNDLAWYDGATDWTPLAHVINGAPNTPSWIPARRDAQVAPTSFAASAAHIEAVASEASSADASNDLAEDGQPLPKAPTVSIYERQRRERKNLGKALMAAGIIILMVGMAITLGSMWAAEARVQGGMFVVAIGPLLAGAGAFVKGLQLFRDN